MRKRHQIARKEVFRQREQTKGLDLTVRDYYEAVVFEPGMPAFFELDAETRQNLEKSSGFARWLRSRLLDNVRDSVLESIARDVRPFLDLLRKVLTP